MDSFVKIMRRFIITFSLFVATLFVTLGQVDNAFTTVTVVNGKVLFEQFIPVSQNLSSNQKYQLLQEWTKKKFAGNPMLAGIRYDEASRTITVSNRTELQNPEKMVMSYRFDVSVNNAGCMLVVRDISYQVNQSNAASFFPKVYTAEQIITDQSLNNAGSEAEWRKAVRRETLQTLNQLAAELAAIF